MIQDSRISEIRKALRSRVTPGKRELLQRFFKTGPGQYAAGDVFIGVMVPQTRQVVRLYWKTATKKDVLVLIHSSVHEERLCGLLMLVEQFQHGTTGEQKAIFDLYLANARYVNNWDLVDLTAPKIVGAWLWGKDTKILDRLARSKNLWERRIAILATFWFIYYKDATVALRIAKILLNDKEDLIHKAVGWMLREAGKRCSADAEREFLRKHAAAMPRTMLRYAIERFPEAERKRFMIQGSRFKN